MQQQANASPRAAGVFARALLAWAASAILLAGCKPTGLPGDEARARLQAALAGPWATQTVDLRSGEVATGRPLAINQFLYAKHWLVCPETSPGAFSSSATCRLNGEGRTFGAANGWTTDETPMSGCEHCTTVRIPVAAVKLERVERVDAADKAHATITYAYDVAPNEFGAQLSAWMASHPLAWCGPDPAAAGGWNAQRTAQASFVRRSGTWVLADQLSGAAFADTFAPPAGKEGKPCPGA